jgi:hypothetical protein
LIDESGNDVYNGSRKSVGAGNSSGFGLLVDNAGDDTYSGMAANVFGNAGLIGSDVDFAGSPRRLVDVIGIFIDAGGTDAYDVAGMSTAAMHDDASWIQFVNMDPMINLIEHGSGVDGTGESTIHARWP